MAEGKGSQSPPYRRQHCKDVNVRKEDGTRNRTVREPPLALTGDSWTPQSSMPKAVSGIQEQKETGIVH